MGRGFVISERLLRKINQREMKTVRLHGRDSLYPVFNIAEFDCIISFYVQLLLNFKELRKEYIQEMKLG